MVAITLVKTTCETDILMALMRIVMLVIVVNRGLHKAWLSQAFMATCCKDPSECETLVEASDTQEGISSSDPCASALISPIFLAASLALSSLSMTAIHGTCDSAHRWYVPELKLLMLWKGPDVQLFQSEGQECRCLLRDWPNSDCQRLLPW